MVVNTLLGVVITPLSLGVGVLFNRVIDLSKVRLEDSD